MDTSHSQEFDLSYVEYSQNDGQGNSEDVVLAQQREFNEKRCFRCCTAFTIFKKKIVCSKCNFATCRKCASWDTEKQIWICKICTSRESSPSPEWLQRKLLERCRVFESARRVRHLQKVFDQYDRDNDSGYHPSMSADAEDVLGSGFGEPVIDPNILEIHEHVEAIVEQIIGDPIDNTTLDPLCHNPEYDRMIEIYHVRLRDALSQLIQSLRMAINEQAMAEEQTPTATHFKLKHIINEVVEEAIGLPYLVETDETSSLISNSQHKDEDDDLENLSYEEILATVILNKVIEMYQKQKYFQRQSPEAIAYYANNELYETNNNRLASSNFSNKEIQTDMETDTESEITKKSLHRVVHSSPTMDFSEDESFGTESAGEDFSWAQNTEERSPSVQYMVEEQIEEITTTFEDPNLEGVQTTSKKGGKQIVQAINEPLGSHSLTRHSVVSDMSYYCSSLGFTDTRKVPFPEFGVDFIEGDEIDDSEQKEVGEFLLVSDRWEDNWLFKTKKMVSPFRNLGTLLIGEEPISMLVPNPQEDVHATIGDRDVDELSDMSEKLSSGSIEFSQSDSESAKGDECEDHRHNVAKTEMPITYIMEAQDLVSNGNENETSTNAPTIRTSVENNVYSNAMKCVSSASGYAKKSSSTKEMRQESPYLPVPVPMPRKSKSSTCSDSGKQVLRFVPLASRKPANTTEIHFSNLPESISVIAGRIARVNCQIVASKPYKIAWFHGCEPLECGELYQFYSIGNDHVLEIYDAQQMDCGTYSCVAYTDSAEAWADFKLTVIGSAPKPSQPHFKQHLRGCFVEEGQKAIFHCKVVGSPEPQLTLFKDGRLLQPCDHFSIDRNSYGDWMIRVTDVKSQDAGDYRVLARNKAGEAVSIAELVVVPHGSLQVMALTERTNNVQDAVYNEAKDLMTSANKLSSMSGLLYVLDKQVKQLEIRIQQSSWADRQSEIKRDALHRARAQEKAASAVRQTTGKALDLLISATDKARKTQKSISTSCTSNENDFSTNVSRPDVIPGTIAEREHKKWENPVELPNNPYSPENIVKRIQRRGSMPRSPLLSDGVLSMAQEDDSDKHEVFILDGPKKIDCGLKDIDPEKYRRDYYVHYTGTTCNSIPVNTRKRASSVQSKKTNAALNDVEEKIYISTGRVLNLEDNIAGLESQVGDVNNHTSPTIMDDLEDKVARAIAQVNQSEKQVSRVEQEVARLQKRIQKRQQNGREHSPLSCGKMGNRSESFSSTSSLDNLLRSKESTPEPIINVDTIHQSTELSLPSVRALASKFDGPCFQNGLFPNGSFEHKDDGSTLVKLDNSQKPPTPKPRRSKLSDVSQCNSLSPEPPCESRHRLSISSTTSSLSADLPNELVTNKPSDLTNQESSSEDKAKGRPSVKVLSQKFFEDSGEGISPSGSGGSSVKRVHSLTARSLSKEFRDATQYHLPRQLNRKISITNDSEKNLSSIFSPPDLCEQPVPNGATATSTGNTNGKVLLSPDDSHGYTSDESSTSTNSLSNKSKPVKKLSRSIQSRAAFWDRRVQEERMNDQSMSEEFPPMDSPEYET